MPRILLHHLRRPQFQEGEEREQEGKTGNAEGVLGGTNIPDLSNRNHELLFVKEVCKMWLLAKENAMLIFAVLIVTTLLVGFACAAIARHKGKDPFIWFVAGAILNILALATVIFIEKKKGDKTNHSNT